MISGKKRYLKLISETGNHTWIDLEAIAFCAIQDGKIVVAFKGRESTLLLPNSPHFIEPLERFMGIRA